MNRMLLTTLFGLVLASVGVAQDVEWGHLSGRFVLDGDVPATKKIPITKDADELGFSEVDDESLVVNKKNKGIANIAIFLRPARGADLKVHPSYEKTAGSKTELKFHKGRFEPHMLLVRTSQTMVHHSMDSVFYSPHFHVFKNHPL